MAKRLKTRYTANGRTVWLQKGVRKGWVVKVQSNGSEYSYSKGRGENYTKAEAEEKFNAMREQDERVEAKLIEIHGSKKAVDALFAKDQEKYDRLMKAFH